MQSPEQISNSPDLTLDLSEKNPEIALNNKLILVDSKLEAWNDFLNCDFPEAIALCERNPKTIEAFFKKYLKTETV